jgi:tRNA(His) 5'-end guanylyltransferase
MWETCLYLCSNIEGCKLGYTQSDEISLLLTDYDSLQTQSWFDKNIQKMVSISASMATLQFNKRFIMNSAGQIDQSIYTPKYNLAIFDSRVFVLPKEEVCNYFIWRQQDATRNAIQMVGHVNFSPKQLHQKNCNQIQDMLFLEKNINFDEFPVSQKRGICTYKESYLLGEATRNRWVIDENIPIFTQNRDYIEKYL